MEHEDKENKFAGNIAIQVIIVLGLILVFILGGILLFNSKYFKHINDKLVSYSNNGDYTVELIAEGSPDWPFGGQKGRVELKNSNGKLISSVNIYVSNDGGKIVPANWSTKWKDDYVVVNVSGFEDKKDTIYKMYYNGDIK